MTIYFSYLMHIFFKDCYVIKVFFNGLWHNLFNFFSFFFTWLLLSASIKFILIFNWDGLLVLIKSDSIDFIALDSHSIW